ncbi:LOW QUALITY PROTEIN: hypothetical protein PHMEG_0009774 [Phytophthora megakarya]|uniref:Eukaryotic/viral aspartic protease n=1 Tax=Phytophthora megakarya TaxID=4795 RepID=A0A225WHF7_9STRA|nr:LOW QUALITY PROTEIN: hypothetical protein PHMEG_0009774 [Phytophthora megakarya]
MTDGRTRIKITFAGAYEYYFDAWVGILSGQEAILGMDFMVPAGIRLDLADESFSLLDEVRILVSWRRQHFSGNARLIMFDEHGNVAGSVENAVRRSLAVKRNCGSPAEIDGSRRGLGRTQYLRITNVSDLPINLQRDTRIGIWLAGDHVPRTLGYVSYDTPTAFLEKDPKSRKVMSVQPSPSVETKIEDPAAGGRSLKPGSDDVDHVTTEAMRVDQRQLEPRDQKGAPHQKIVSAEVLVKSDREADDGMDDAVCYPEGGNIFPPNTENHMASSQHKRRRFTGGGSICDARRVRTAAPHHMEAASPLKRSRKRTAPPQPMRRSAILMSEMKNL